MTRVRWLSLSATTVVGVVAGFLIGFDVGRGAAPPAVPATVVDETGRTTSLRVEAPALAGTAAPPTLGDLLTLDLRADPSLAARPTST